MNLKTRFENFMGKLLYSVIIASHHEDYISEDKNGNTVVTPASVWHAAALSNKQITR